MNILRALKAFISWLTTALVPQLLPLSGGLNLLGLVSVRSPIYKFLTCWLHVCNHALSTWNHTFRAKFGRFCFKSIAKPWVIFSFVRFTSFEVIEVSNTSYIPKNTDNGLVAGEIYLGPPWCTYYRETHFLDWSLASGAMLVSSKFFWIAFEQHYSVMLWLHACFYVAVCEQSRHSSCG